MSGVDIPFPHVLGPGELVHKVLVITIEMAAGKLRQVIALSRWSEGGGIACCYHIGRLVGERFLPDTADCFQHPAAADIDLCLEAILSAVRSAAKDKFITHVIYDLSAIATQDEQLAFLASRGLGHVIRREAN